MQCECHAMEQRTQDEVDRMKAVDQTMTGFGGNCLSACLASLLEEDIANVPTVHSQHDANQWLAHRGYVLNQLTAHPSERFYIIGGRSPRGLMHAVIARDGVIVHDPHPTKVGLLTRDYVFTLDLIVPWFDSMHQQ